MPHAPELGGRASRVALLAIALGICSPSRPASAQVARADSAAVLLGAAADFEREGESDTAETLYRHITGRFPDTPAAETARTRLEAAGAERSQAGGETELKVWSTIYGTWLGIMVPAAFDVDRPEPYGAGLMLGAPGGFFGSRAFAASRPLSLGQARAITWGGTWGALQGMALARAMDLGGSERESGQAVVASMIAGSAVGIAGGMLAAREEIRPGTATAANLGSLWGAWLGLASSILLDLEENPTYATVAVTGNAGLVAGAFAGSRWPLSRSRARLISVGGLIGTVAGFGLLLLADTDFDDVSIAVPLTGSIAGLVVGTALTSGNDARQETGGDAAADDTPPATGALLSWSDGDWSLSVPLPSPVLDPGRWESGRDGVAWSVRLLNAWF